MNKIPIPKRVSLLDIKTLRSFSEFYKKELAKNPEYGKKRKAREKKQKDMDGWQSG